MCRGYPMTSDESVYREPVGPDQYTIVYGTYPNALVGFDRWFNWAYTDGRKVPRAPWNYPDWLDRHVSWKDPENWLPFGVARDWSDKLGFGIATCLPELPSGSQREERIVFIDCDDVRCDERGVIHPQAWHLLDSWDVHVALSTSGTGLHGFGIASLPEGKRSTCVLELRGWPYTDDPEIEFYAEDRFIAVTGKHIAGTPMKLPGISKQIHDIYNAHARDVTPDIEDGGVGGGQTPTRGDQTSQPTDTEKIFNAVDAVRPRDINLLSSVTNERPDGTADLDPSWESSESGARLGQFDDGWVYRQGMIGLSALEIVALEAGIVSKPGDYPKGDDYWAAVDELRDRGADIPKRNERCTDGKTRHFTL